MSSRDEYRRLLAEYAPQPIHSAHDHRRALAMLEKIMTPHPSTAQSLLIELLATLIERYESQAHPTPQAAPADMLAHLLESKGVKCADLARQTGIGPATLSNVLSGRRGISKDNAVRLGRHFDVSPAMFLHAEIEAADAKQSR